MGLLSDIKTSFVDAYRLAFGRGPRGVEKKKCAFCPEPLGNRPALYITREGKIAAICAECSEGLEPVSSFVKNEMPLKLPVKVQRYDETKIAGSS